VHISSCPFYRCNKRGLIAVALLTYPLHLFFSLKREWFALQPFRSASILLIRGGKERRIIDAGASYFQS